MTVDAVVFALVTTDVKSVDLAVCGYTIVLSNPVVLLQAQGITKHLFILGPISMISIRNTQIFTLRLTIT